MKILDLGGYKCDDTISVNLDRCDVVHDLNVFPYPFSVNSFDEVRIYHVLEHLKLSLIHI